MRDVGHLNCLPKSRSCWFIQFRNANSVPQLIRSHVARTLRAGYTTGMDKRFEAIYERGVFRPLEPVDLPDQTKVHLQLQEGKDAPSLGASTDDLSKQKIAMQELLHWVHSLPAETVGDRVSAGDHNQILYGWQK